MKSMKTVGAVTLAAALAATLAACQPQNNGGGPSGDETTPPAVSNTDLASETAEITQIIRRMRDEGGYTILLVEHKMNLVGEISDRVVVLDYGRKIAEGTYREVVDNPAVIEAYLGKRAAEEGRSADLSDELGDLP